MCLLVIFVVVAYDVLIKHLFNDQTSLLASRYLNPDLWYGWNKSWVVLTVGAWIQMPDDLRHLIC